jgi:hypothetical protein
MNNSTLFQAPETIQHASAIISPCGRYRYSLTRGNCDQKPVLFVMLNPSTADALEDDPTIRRCVGFAKSWSYDSIQVVNLFAWRATDPNNLPWKSVEAVGPENDDHINQHAKSAGLIVCAWGNHVSTSSRASHVIRLLKSSGVPVKCLGRNKSGTPKHPLYLASNTQLEDFI